MNKKLLKHYGIALERTIQYLMGYEGREDEQKVA